MFLVFVVIIFILFIIFNPSTDYISKTDELILWYNKYYIEDGKLKHERQWCYLFKK